MADLTMTTPAQVLQTDNTVVVNGTFGMTVTAGQCVYQDRETYQFLLADANTTREAANVVGLTLNGGGIGQTAQVAIDGDVIMGAVAAPVVGTFYVLSATPGGIAPVADLASGWHRTVIGCGALNNIISLGINAYGIVG